MMRKITFTGCVLVVLVLMLTGCGRDDDAPTAALEAETPPGEPGLTGRVLDVAGDPLQGVMVTARDPDRHLGATVFTDETGTYRFPALDPRPYRVKAHRRGYRETEPQGVELGNAEVRADFTLEVEEAFHDQLSAAHYNARLAKAWPSDQIRNNFTYACANCHQIGNATFRKPDTEEQWNAVIEWMETLGGIELAEETRKHAVPMLMEYLKSDGSDYAFERPAAPSGDVLQAVIWEYDLVPGEAVNCHDPEVGLDGRLYTEDGYWLDPVTAERGLTPIDRGNPHSLKTDPDGNLWITITGEDLLARWNPNTEEVTYFEHPEIDGERGIYPHTLKFDDSGRFWYTLTVTNHVNVFDPATGEMEYHRLPHGQGREGDPPVPKIEALTPDDIPIAYGLDIAPDGGVWWSQLLGGRIGRLDPETRAIEAWPTPLPLPRRIGAGLDGRIWVPFYGEAHLGGFDPATQEWELHPLPTGEGELPYALAVHPDTGDVWITGSNSDTVIRFDPDTSTFTVYPLPSANSFTRDIVFDAAGDVWTCSAANLLAAEEKQSAGRFVRIDTGGER